MTATVLTGGQEQVLPPAEQAPASAPGLDPAKDPAPQAASWFDRMSPEEQQWAGSKGWKADTDVVDVVKSYQNLEKLFGADKAGNTVVLPKDASDKAALDAVYKRLGRPDTADGYDIDVPEGVNPEFSVAARNTFHKAGLTAEQAKSVMSAYMGIELDARAAAEAERANRVEALQKEWGAEFDTKVETAKAAIRAAGLDDNQVQLLEMAIGPDVAARVMEFFGRAYVEAGPPGGERVAPTFSGLSPASAASKMEQLRADPGFMARYGSPDPKTRAEAIEEMDRLARVAVNARM